MGDCMTKKKFSTCFGQVCSMCNEFKNFEYFDVQKDKTTGYRSRCKICRNKEHKRRYKLEHVRRSAQESSWRNQGIVGMTVELYDQMLKDQNYRCTICQKTEKENKKRLAVDHNHTTGKVGALICDFCNNGLGRFNDDLDLMYNAVAYLERFEVSYYE